MSDFIKKVHDHMAQNPGMSYADAARSVRSATQSAPIVPTTPPAPVQNAPVAPTPVQQAPVQTTPTVQTTPQAPAPQVPPATPNTGNFTGQVQQYMQANPGVAYADAARAVRSANTPNMSATNIPAPQRQAAPPPTANREMEIMKNLNEGFTYNPALFESRENFDRAYNYASKPENERAILDSFWNSKKGDVGSFFDTLASGGRVNDAGLEASIASMRYSTAKMYAGMKPSVLVKEIANGNLLEGSEEWEDLMRINPKLAEEVQTLARINGVTPKIVTRNSDGTLSNTLELKSHEKMLERFAGLLERTDAESVMREIMTPEFTRYQAKKEALMEEIMSLSDDIEKIDRDIDKDLAGTGASGSRKRLEAIQRRRELGDDLSSKTRRLSVYQNEQDAIWNRGLIAYDRAEQINGALRNAGLNMYQSVFNENLRVQAAWNDFENKIAMNERMMNDPTMAISQLVESYQAQGIPMQRSVQEMIADFHTSGKSLPQYLTELNKTIQSKPEWQALQTAQMNKWLPPMEANKYGFQNLGGGMIAVTDPITGEVRFEQANVGSVGTEGVGTLSTRRLNAKNGEFVGVECGQFAREAAGLSTLPGGNNLEARKKEFKDRSAMAGGMILFTGNGYDKTYGHIALVESVNPDGSLNIVESNLKNDKKVTRRIISATDPAIHGFYNNTPLAKKINGEVTGNTGKSGIWDNIKSAITGGGIKGAMSRGISALFGRKKEATTSDGSYRKELGPLYEKMNAGKMTTADYKTLQSMGVGEEEFMMQAYNYLNKPVDPNNPQLLTMEQNLKTIQDIIKQDNVNAVAGDRQNWWNFGKRDQTYVRKIENILSSQVLQTLIDAKANGATFGALSDTELQMLKSAANVLAGAINPDKKGFDLSEAELREQLNQLEQMYARAIERMKQGGGTNGSTYTKTNNVSNMSMQAQEDAILHAFLNK